MAKTVYSLVLADEIVQAVDALAAQKGMSRSTLVNQILAEYAHVSTPEMRAQEMLDAVRQLAEQGGIRSQTQTGGRLILRTALSYKYNPALSYTVQWQEEEGSFGRLQVALRSQNAAVLSCFDAFFLLWQQWEQLYMDTPPAAHQQGNQALRYQRALRYPAQPTGAEALGESVAAYIMGMDSCLRMFFRNANDLPTAAKKTEETYRRFFDKNGAAHLL